MNATNSDLQGADFIGKGLEERTYEDCLQEHLNPNRNAAGEIQLPDDSAKMEEHIARLQGWSLKALAAK